METAAAEKKPEVRVTCASCPHFSAPPTPPKGVDAGSHEKYRLGTCKRFPRYERHYDHDVCGEHPVLRRRMLSHLASEPPVLSPPRRN